MQPLGLRTETGSAHCFGLWLGDYAKVRGEIRWEYLVTLKEVFDFGVDPTPVV